MFYIMNEITIVPKLFDSTVYYIFRENGQEVKVKVSGDYPVSSHKLTSNEINFINENII